MCGFLQNPTLPALNCSVENAHPTVSYYARPQVASYNTYYHSPPHLPPYSAYDFQVCFEGEKKELSNTLALIHVLLFSPQSWNLPNIYEVARLCVPDGFQQPLDTSDQHKDYVGMQRQDRWEGQERRNWRRNREMEEQRKDQVISNCLDLRQGEDGTHQYLIMDPCPIVEFSISLPQEETSS